MGLPNMFPHGTIDKALSVLERIADALEKANDLEESRLDRERNFHG